MGSKWLKPTILQMLVSFVSWMWKIEKKIQIQFQIQVDK